MRGRIQKGFSRLEIDDCGGCISNRRSFLVLRGNDDVKQFAASKVNLLLPALARIFGFFAFNFTKLDSASIWLNSAVYIIALVIIFCSS